MAAALSFFLLLLLLPAPLLLLPLAGNLPAAVLGEVRVERDLILVDLQDYGSGVGTLAVRPDVFSVAGFANRTGHWHALRGNDHLFRGDLVATPLPFGSSYGDLVGGVNNLLGLPLGSPFTSYATVVLSGYDGGGGGEAGAGDAGGGDLRGAAAPPDPGDHPDAGARGARRRRAPAVHRALGRHVGGAEAVEADRRVGRRAVRRRAEGARQHRQRGGGARRRRVDVPAAAAGRRLHSGDVPC
uniref:rRNA N-glycosylase n=1 Tax=Oryza glaberrima TaxID=4538 RepID=I1PEQ6_ORYGL